MARSHSLWLEFAVVSTMAICGDASAQKPIMGFSPAATAREVQVETRFKAIPSAEEERRQHRLFTAEPHPAGSKRNNELAEYIAAEWRKQGLEDIVVRQYDVYSYTHLTLPTSDLV